MKKILFLLLLAVAGYGQTGTGQEQDLDYGMRVPIDTLQTVTTPSYLGTFGNTGVIGKIPSAYIEKTSDKISTISGYSETSYPNEKAAHDALDLKLNISDLPTNLTLYPTNVASDVGGYVKMVTDIHDVDYNTVAVDVSTPTITGTAQLVSQRISAPGVLIGQPGVFNITTFGNIKRLSGTGTANFYFEVYHRDLAGTETLICTSSVSDVVSLSTYSEFTASGIWDDGDFISTDRIVIKTYANRIAGGTDPVYQFQFGGSQPVRTLLPVPFSVVDAGYEMKTNKSDSYTASSSTTYASTKALVDGLEKKGTKIKIVIEGDSRSALPSPTSIFWDTYFKENSALGKMANVINLASGGDTIENMILTFNSQVLPHAPVTGELAYFILYAGANDLGPGLGHTGAVVYDDWKTLVTLAKNAGFVVVAGCDAGAAIGWTVGQRAECDIFNALIRSDKSYYEFLLEPDLVLPASDVSNYSDGIHFTNLGSEKFARHVAQKMSESEKSNITIDFSRFEKTLSELSVASGNLTNYIAPSGGLYNYYSGGGVIASFGDNIGTLTQLNLESSILVGKTNGVERFVVTNNGNFGIGTASPINNTGYGGFSLNGTDGGIISMMQGGSETFRVANYNGYSFINTTGNTPLLLGTNSVEAFRITETGDIKLTVIPTTSVGTYDFLTRNTSTGVVEKVVSSDIATKSLTVRKISTNTTLANSDNGTIILLTASCTVTLPNGLMNGFNCSFSTQTGVTMTYSLGGSVTLINNTGTTMAQNLSHTIVNTGTSNEYLTAGSL